MTEEVEDPGIAVDDIAGDQDKLEEKATQLVCAFRASKCTFSLNAI